jgi:hypothetical protein
MNVAHATAVWLSAGSASVLVWTDAAVRQLHIESSVPARHRSTGHAPTAHRPAGEGHQDEHMRTYFAEIARVVPDDDDLLLLGDGEVVGHFAQQVRAEDAAHGRHRRVEVERSQPMTDGQLRARTQEFAGSPAKRGMR